MGKYTGYLLMSDFDGTLYHNGISAKNQEAIRSFVAEGGLFTLATGRSSTWIAQFSEQFRPNAPCAVMNGSVICNADGSEVLFRAAVDADFEAITRKILLECPELNWVNVFHETDAVCVKRGEPLDSALFSVPVYKAVFHAPAERSDEYKAIIRSIAEPNYRVMRSWINGIEVMRADVGKGAALCRIKQMLGDRARVAIAVGDYENDIDMIEAADIGYAVENAIPALKQIADRVTVPCSEHAIARIIEEI